MPAGLQIQPVTSAGGVDQAERDLAPIPRLKIRARAQLAGMRKAVVDSGEVVFEPVGDEDGLSVGGLDDVFEGIEFRPMHLDGLAMLVVDRARGELQ